MSFRVRGLSREPFAALFAMDDNTLAARGVRKLTADEPHSAPCRVSLQDAEPGETLLLLSHEHQPAASPFRASGPIFIREKAGAAFDGIDQIPDAIARRTISVRAYDALAMMVDGDLADGANLAPLLEQWLQRPQVDVIHLHYARRGCYAAVVVRA